METTIIENTNLYRIVWKDMVTEKGGKGTFLFNDPTEAREPIVHIKATVPTCQVWLEDRNGNKVEIPPR